MWHNEDPPHLSFGRRVSVRFIRQSRGYMCTRLEVSLNRPWVNKYGIPMMWPVREFKIEWRKVSRPQ